MPKFGLTRMMLMAFMAITVRGAAGFRNTNNERWRSARAGIRLRGSHELPVPDRVSG